MRQSGMYVPVAKCLLQASPALLPDVEATLLLTGPLLLAGPLFVFVALLVVLLGAGAGALALLFGPLFLTLLFGPLSARDARCQTCHAPPLAVGHAQQTIPCSPKANRTDKKTVDLVRGA